MIETTRSSPASLARLVAAVSVPVSLLAQTGPLGRNDKKVVELHVQRGGAWQSFRFLIDPTDGKASNQFPGWPVTIHQEENRGRNRLE